MNLTQINQIFARDIFTILQLFDIRLRYIFVFSMFKLRNVHIFVVLLLRIFKFSPTDIPIESGNFCLTRNVKVELFSLFFKVKNKLTCFTQEI